MGLANLARFTRRKEAYEDRQENASHALAEAQRVRAVGLSRGAQNEMALLGRPFLPKPVVGITLKTASRSRMAPQRDVYLNAPPEFRSIHRRSGRACLRACQCVEKGRHVRGAARAVRREEAASFIGKPTLLQDVSEFTRGHGQAQQRAQRMTLSFECAGVQERRGIRTGWDEQREGREWRG
eukprot:6196559-Pleurochrysis_carterae.AAC.3